MIHKPMTHRLIVNEKAIKKFSLHHIDDPALFLLASFFFVSRPLDDSQFKVPFLKVQAYTRPRK
jgi:hypothetical protein